MPIIKLTSGDDNPVLVNTDHILVVRHRTDEDGSEYCQIEMQDIDPSSDIATICVNETIDEIQAVIKAAS
jgi:hypothetical protein